MNTMNKIFKFSIITLLVCGVAHVSRAQEFDEERMRRDIEIAENVLTTLIKQEIGQQRTFLGIDVNGSYQPGYGVTFRIPTQHSLPFVIRLSQELEPTMTISNNGVIVAPGNEFEFAQGMRGLENEQRVLERHQRELENAHREIEEARREAEAHVRKLTDRTRKTADSIRLEFNQKIISAAQKFILDYGDFLSQLKPDERIVVTNQDDRNFFYFSAEPRTRITIEGKRSDIVAFKNGKISREEALKRLKIVNTEVVVTKEADLEMLASIFSRLYRPDLSKTYFVEGNIYYERLRDVGAVFYMRVVSSHQSGPDRYVLPTMNLNNLTLAERDKHVKDVYPTFESDIKDNLLEYGRTVKSLGDNEDLIFNVSMTRCTGCGIPSSLELSIKASTLKDFNSGKIDKNAALKRITVKKGENQ